MTIRFYSPSTKGFYNSDVNSEIPEDAVKITEEEYCNLYEGQSCGKIIVYKDKKLSLDIYKPSEEDLSRRAKAKRSELLKETDWVVLRAKETGKQIPAIWKSYRQALRDITLQDNYPFEIEWPERPE